ncbi:CCC motif membrane protein [Lacinutrix jangbogonensis]|uniref:CCC motif membrane protein n=1 Tax=Lacinutrix jangbogonensis TaxID=1469557 RepID=UPI00053D5C18|nr:CCC motif membrane protein [Lacinutrix jangbogonensis]
MKKKLNPTVVYVLSIVGLLCCCFGGLGILLSAPAYFIAGNKIKDAQLNPDAYEGETKPMETAKLVAMIIMIINVLYLIYTIYQISTIGWDEMNRTWQEAIEQAQQAQ